MVGGAAYYAGRRVNQGEMREADQQQRISDLEAQANMQQQYAPPPPPPPQYAPPPPPAAPQKSTAEQLMALKELLDANLITEAEFATEKAKVLKG